MVDARPVEAVTDPVGDGFRERPMSVWAATSSGWSPITPAAYPAAVRSRVVSVARARAAVSRASTAE
ncbi:hypothetical protein BRD17_06555 [Halobacteriales archaeon SW_7_68_16]|nr:MAG: hypothetical protein BRD17_06555 [Halobacteriales archaeon SW_7_68_16]